MCHSRAGLILARILAVAFLPACSSLKRPAVTPDPLALERLAAADALVRAGCLDCLEAAFHEYDVLRTVPVVAAAATDRAVRAAVLVALRERELGVEESGYLERAQDLAAGNESLRETFVSLAEIADTMPLRAVWGPPPTSDAQLARVQLALKNREAWLARLHAHLDTDPLFAYLWLAFNCANTRATREAVDRWLTELAAWREVPLIGLKRATCGGVDTAALEQLLKADARFVELHYYLASGATLQGKLNEAADHLQHAYAWRPRWPAVTNSLANVYVTAEEFDQAVDFFDRTLTMVPEHPDALLGKTRALTYLGQNTDALAVVDQLLALGRWYIGDARYWRAFNEMQLGRNDAAWVDIEDAGKLLINADVPKLAGIIAYRRKQIDVSRAKFEESRERNRLDCETGFYLGIVLTEQLMWNRAANVLVETGGCLEAAERGLTEEIEKIRRSEDPPERQRRRVAKREQQIASGRRMMATAWFNVAVAYFNLSRKDEARQYAERVAADEQLGARARELLSRLP